MVILDSSTYRHLAYTYDAYGPESEVFVDTRELILRGSLDCGRLPATRVILSTSAEDIFQNLRNRGFSDEGDPLNLDQIEQRIKAYRETRGIISSLPGSEEISWIEVQNPSLDETSRSEGLVRLIDTLVIPRLSFIIERFS